MDVVINQNKTMMEKLDIVIEQNKTMMARIDVMIEQNNRVAKRLKIQDQKLDAMLKILNGESSTGQKKQALVVMDDPQKSEVSRGKKMQVKSQSKRKQDSM